MLKRAIPQSVISSHQQSDYDLLKTSEQIEFSGLLEKNFRLNSGSGSTAISHAGSTKGMPRPGSAENLSRSGSFDRVSSSSSDEQAIPLDEIDSEPIPMDDAAGSLHDELEREVGFIPNQMPGFIGGSLRPDVTLKLCG